VTRTAASILAAVALLAGATTLAQSPVAPTSTPAFAKRVAGTYFVVEEATGIREFLTLFADGNALLNSSAEGDFAFGSSQGVWEQTGPREIAMRMANFDFDDQGTAVIDVDVSFDPAFELVVGSFSGALYDDSVNPIHPGNAVPLFTFADEIAGERMRVR
jgi:hypothetical protein